MKKQLKLAVTILFTFNFGLSILQAQSPEKMSYQAVVRNSSNALVSNQAIGMQISILQGSITGTAVYEETQTPTTNINGLVSLEIGSGTVVSGNFNTINWANGPYFIKTETDPTGGTTYTITGTSQLMSVPYALHAKTATSITGTITETDPIFGASVANAITVTDTANWNNHTIDTDTQLDSTDIANLGYVANGITTETDPTYTAWNKSTGISIIESQISNLTHTIDTDTHIDSTGIAALGFTSGVHTTKYTNAEAIAAVGAHTVDTDTQLDSTDIANLGYVAGGITTEIDGSTTNEIQTISRTGTIVTLSNSGGTFTDSVNTYTAGSGIDISVGNVISATSGSSDKFYLGQDTLGGIVYYIYKDAAGKQHGLIVSKTETNAAWQAATALTGADRTEDGAFNTGQMTNSPAETYVTNLGTGWYLPSLDELILLSNNRFSANRGLRTGSFTLLTIGGGYWSSTEASSIQAYYHVMGSVGGPFDKLNPFFVRAIRSF